MRMSWNESLWPHLLRWVLNMKECMLELCSSETHKIKDCICTM